MVAFSPENDMAALDALMELAEAPGQCIKHPEFIENYPGSDYVMTPAMFADEYDLVTVSYTHLTLPTNREV